MYGITKDDFLLWEKKTTHFLCVSMVYCVLKIIHANAFFHFLYVKLNIKKLCNQITIKNAGISGHCYINRKLHNQ